MFLCFYISNIYYISVCRIKIIITLFWQNQDRQSAFSCLLFYLQINDNPCLIRYLSISFTLAISWSSAAQKIGVSHRLHPSPISLYKALYGFLTAQSSLPIPSAMDSNLTPSSAKLSPFPAYHFSLIHLLCYHSHFGLQKGQKNRCRLWTTPNSNRWDLCYFLKANNE